MGAGLGGGGHVGGPALWGLTCSAAPAGHLRPAVRYKQHKNTFHCILAEAASKLGARTGCNAVQAGVIVPPDSRARAPLKVPLFVALVPRVSVQVTALRSGGCTSVPGAG
jgi:hypothetical protein